MMKVISIEKFNTSFGLAFIIKAIDNLKVGQQIMIDDSVYQIRKIQMQSTPSDAEAITVFV